MSRKCFLSLLSISYIFYEGMVRNYKMLQYWWWYSFLCNIKGPILLLPFYYWSCVKNPSFSWPMHTQAHTHIFINSICDFLIVKTSYECYNIKCNLLKFNLLNIFNSYVFILVDTWVVCKLLVISCTTAAMKFTYVSMWTARNGCMLCVL
jgi:hypothetical protein